MLARTLGGSVRRHAEGRVEVGYYPIKATEAGRDLMTWPERVYQWHNEGFEVGHCGTLLAAGDDFPNQAFVYGQRAFGIQFHPEVTLAMMHRWTVKGCARCELPGARPPFEHIDGRTLYDGAVRNWLAQFMDLWLAPAPARSETPALIAAE
jgi:GMP synthase (glutamine-hydrolysing)